MWELRKARRLEKAEQYHRGYFSEIECGNSAQHVDFNRQNKAIVEILLG